MRKNQSFSRFAAYARPGGGNELWTRADIPGGRLDLPVWIEQRGATGARFYAQGPGHRHARGDASSASEALRAGLAGWVSPFIGGLRGPSALAALEFWAAHSRLADQGRRIEIRLPSGSPVWVGEVEPGCGLGIDPDLPGWAALHEQDAWSLKSLISRERLLANAWLLAAHGLASA